MALCCDLRIASEEARFGLPEVTLGIIPAAGGSQTLPRTIGRAKSLEMLLTNRWIDAREAMSAGLVNRVVARQDLTPTVERLASRPGVQAPPDHQVHQGGRIQRSQPELFGKGWTWRGGWRSTCFPAPVPCRRSGHTCRERATRFHDT